MPPVASILTCRAFTRSGLRERAQSVPAMGNSVPSREASSSAKARKQELRTGTLLGSPATSTATTAWASRTALA